MQNTVREFNQAEFNGDGATACSKLTPTEQQRTQQGLPNQTVHYSSCAEAVHDLGPALASMLNPDEKNQFLNPTFTGSEVNGNVGDVAYKDGEGIHRATLNKAGGAWLIQNVT